MRKNYIVHYKRGRIAVTVDDSVINLRGERFAVAQAAWHKLLGENSLGELEPGFKQLKTRKEIHILRMSRLEHERASVYETFMNTINFTWVSNG